MEKRNWQAMLFIVLTTMLLALTVLTLLFPGVLDYLQELRAEGDLDRYAGLLSLIILLYCIYVLRMQTQLGRMRSQMVDEQISLRSLKQLVVQLKRLMHVATTMQVEQRLEETLRVLVGAAQDSLETRAVSVIVRSGPRPAEAVSAGQSALQKDQTMALAERLKDSLEPLLADRPGQVAALLGSVPAGLGALLAIPLRDSRGALGVMIAEFPEQAQRALLEHQLDLLRVYAENAAIAIENNALVAKIERMAITDELTGLYNRRYFHQELEREIPRAERMGRPFSLLLFDIDHFKQINDTYGHDVGDEALRQVARALHSRSRKSNLLARFGGEEFVTMLVETGGEGALAAAERMRGAMETIQGLPRKLTISAGVAVYPQHGRNTESLLKAADEALYAAKHAGRNQVQVAQAGLSAVS